MIGVKPGETVYCPLPLYHTAAGGARCCTPVMYHPHNRHDRAVRLHGTGDLHGDQGEVLRLAILG